MFNIDNKKVGTSLPCVTVTFKHSMLSGCLMSQGSCNDRIEDAKLISSEKRDVGTDSIALIKVRKVQSKADKVVLQAEYLKFLP